MQLISQADAQVAIALQSTNNTISEADIKQLLGNASVTFAQILYVTAVQTAAAHKQEKIKKVTSANVILCSNINAHTNVYARKVKRSAAAFAQNDPNAVASFTAQPNYFTHTPTCHSIVLHKNYEEKKYLYCIYNNAVSVYMHNGVLVDVRYVGRYLTPSAREELLRRDELVRNVTYGIVHNVRVHTIALSNIVRIKARKQVLTL